MSNKKNKQHDATYLAIKTAVENKEISIEEGNELILNQKIKDNKLMVREAMQSKEEFKQLFNILKKQQLKRQNNSSELDIRK